MFEISMKGHCKCTGCGHKAADETPSVVEMIPVTGKLVVKSFSYPSGWSAVHEDDNVTEVYCRVCTRKRS